MVFDITLHFHVSGYVKLFCQKNEVFTDIPGTTVIAEYKTVFTPENPIRSKPYHHSFSLKKDINKELDNMLKWA